VTGWIGGGEGGVEGVTVSGGVEGASLGMSEAAVTGASERMRAFVSSGASTDSFVRSTRPFEEALRGADLVTAACCGGDGDAASWAGDSEVLAQPTPSVRSMAMASRDALIPGTL
jgi:hypothetical protein